MFAPHLIDGTKQHPHGLSASLQSAIVEHRWEDADKILDCETAVAGARLPFGNERPLHAAIRASAPDQLVLALLRAYPRATCEYSAYQRLNIDIGAQMELTIHLAICMGASEEVMEALIETTSRFSTLELEVEVISFAIRCGVSQSTLRLLLTTWPSAINREFMCISTGFSMTSAVFLLHEALSAGASETVIQMLLAEYPEVVGRKDHSGLLPLHHALQRRASETIICQLIAACPSAVSEKVESRRHPESGNYPIHLAIKYRASDAVMMLLINSGAQVVSQGGLS